MADSSGSEAFAPARARGRARTVVFCGAGFAALVGASAIAGWLLGEPVLTAIGSPTIPVAPSTAVLFVLYSAAIVARQRGLRRATAAMALLGALLPVAVIEHSRRDALFEFEHAGLAMGHPPGAAPRGHMSPVTATAFLLTSAALLASLGGRRAGWLARGLAGFLMAAGCLLALAYLYGQPFLHGGTFIPPAAATSVAFVALGIALLGQLVAPAAVPDPSRTLVLIFAALGAGIVVAGFLFYRGLAARQHREVALHLDAVAAMAAGRLADWRAERLADGDALATSTAFHKLVRTHIAHPTDASARALQTWLAEATAARYRRVSLIDAAGVTRLSIPDGGPAFPHALDCLAERRTMLLDQRPSGQEGTALAVAAPIRDAGIAVGAVLLEVDARERLDPILASPPTPMRESEVDLVRREGGDVVLLGPSRGDPTAVRALRSLLAAGGPDGKAALGERGIAAIRQVPGSPWVLVVRADRAAVNAPIRDELWLTVLAVALLLGTASAGTLALWRRERGRLEAQVGDRDRRLGESEQRYRGVLDCLLGGFQVIGRDWRYLYVNDSAARSGRRTKQDLLGRTVMQCYPGIEQTRLFAVLRACMDERTPARIEEEFVFPDGAREWFELGIQPAPEGVLVVSQEIGERKRAEQQLARWNLELEGRVRERTAELEAANRQLGGFCSAVSHDLKAPLRAVDGYSRLLAEACQGRLDSAAQELLAGVRQGVQRMDHLIDGLLAYSRMDRRGFETQPLRLRPLVLDLLAERGDEIAANRADVRVDLPDVDVVADPEGLGIALRNLIGNALKFSRRAEPPVVEIGGDGDDEAVRVWIRDNGPGFDMKFHDRIFEMFHRLHPAGTFEGTGVGLALVRRAMERMGGRAWAESSPGQGATFFLNLPLHGGTGAAAPRESPGEAR